MGKKVKNADEDGKTKTPVVIKHCFKGGKREHEVTRFITIELVGKIAALVVKIPSKEDDFYKN